MTVREEEVRKTYKLFVGGQMVRSESGRAEIVAGVNVPRASRKDLRDAVRAARRAFPGWSGKTAYNRGQILYRTAEMLDARRAEFAAITQGGRREVQSSVDALMWYAGWCDKLHQVAGTVNPVASPHFVFTLPEPMGVVGLALGEDQALLRTIARVAAAICGGNTVVAVVEQAAGIPVLTLAEVVASSDVPAGVVNILSGSRRELVPWLASHMDVNAIDVGDCDQEIATDAARRAADNVKRVVRSDGQLALQAVTDLMEFKTVWHPVGA